MTDTPNQVSSIADWEGEGGALRPILGESRTSAAHFRKRESYCRKQAEECGRSEMRSTYLGFAARYAGCARFLEGESKIELTIV